MRSKLPIICPLFLMSSVRNKSSTAVGFAVTVLSYWHSYYSVLCYWHSHYSVLCYCHSHYRVLCYWHSHYSVLCYWLQPLQRPCQNIQCSLPARFSPTFPTSAAAISHVVADVEAPGGEKWENLKSGENNGKLPQRTCSGCSRLTEL